MRYLIAAVTALLVIPLTVLALRTCDTARNNTDELARYRTLCDRVASTFEVGAQTAADGDFGGTQLAAMYSYDVVQACAIAPPIDLHARDACWVAGDTVCLARELHKIAVQLQRNR